MPPPIRRFVERLARGRTLWRRLPPPFAAGRVLVTPDAALSYLRPGSSWCDAELLAVVERWVKPGDAVWDVGANVGVFGAAAAVRAGPGGQVLCVEPDLLLAQLVRRTAAALPRGTAAAMSVLAAAVAEPAGVAEFLIADRGRASNALAEHRGRTQTGGVRERHLVPVVPLDALLAVSRPPAVVKVDVEGAEAAVLRSGRAVLHDARPTVYLEVGPEHVDACTALLRDARYALFAPAGGPPLDRCTWNTVAVPAERAG